MKTFPKRWGVLATALAVASCAPSDPLRGQVFVVTQGAESVRLGLVTVRLIPESILLEHIEARRTAARAESLVLAGRLKSFDDSAAEEMWRADSVYVSAQQSYNASIARDRANFRDNAVSLDAYLHGQKKTAALRPRIDSALLKRESTQRAIAARRDLLVAALAALRSGTFYFEGVPPGIDSARTDADGRFVLKVPRQRRYALAAKSSRQVLGTTEEYVWFVWVTKEMIEGGSVLLSNDNLSTVGGPAVALHTER